MLIIDTNISSSFFYGDILIEYIVHYRGVGVDRRGGGLKSGQESEGASFRSGPESENKLKSVWGIFKS